MIGYFDEVADAARRGDMDDEHLANIATRSGMEVTVGTNLSVSSCAAISAVNLPTVDPLPTVVMLRNPGAVV